MYAFIPSLRRELGRLLSGRVAPKYAIASRAMASRAVLALSGLPIEVLLCTVTVRANPNPNPDPDSDSDSDSDP